jgi:hypothetical protein
MDAMSVNEFRNWCAFYQWESEKTSGRTVLRPRTPEEANAAVLKMFSGRNR